MQIRAKKTFSGRNGLVRAGIVVTVADSYGAALIRLGIAERHDPTEPQRTIAHEAAPVVKGNAERGGASPRENAQNEASALSAGPQDDGETKSSSSRRRGRPSRKAT